MTGAVKPQIGAVLAVEHTLELGYVCGRANGSEHPLVSESNNIKQQQMVTSKGRTETQKIIRQAVFTVCVYDTHLLVHSKL